MKTKFAIAILAAGVAVPGTPAHALPTQVAASVHVSVRAARISPAAPGEAAAEAGAAIAVPGATVAVRGAGLQAATDARGVAVLRGLSPGWHVLVVSAPGFVEAAVEVEAVNGRVTRTGVVLDPAPVRLRGLVVQVASRERAAGATVLETASLPPGVTDLPTALERVPGATVVRQGGPGAPAVLQLRGAGGDQVLVLLDGTPINSPLTGTADLSTVDLGSVSRIVVIPGAQSARYGPQALGGVVLLESRDRGATTAAVTAGMGAWSSAETAITGSSDVGNAWSISGGARWRRSNGAFTYDVPAFRGGGETTRENSAFSHAGGDLRITRRGNAEASLRTHVSDIERGSPGTIAQPSATGRQRHRRYGLGVTVESDGACPASRLGGSARGSVQWQRAEYADPEPPFGRAYDTRTRVRRAELALEGWWSAEAAPSPGEDVLDLRFGLHAARLDVESNALTSDAIGLDELGAWGHAGHGWQLRPGFRIDLGASLRADRHDLVDGVILSPAVEAALSRAGLALDLRWGRGFSPPGLGDLFFQEGVLVEPNPDLRPERIRGELSATLSQRWSVGLVTGELRATAYRADLDDMILWFPDHRFVWSPDNYDVARRGLELGATTDLTAFGRTHSLTAGAAWSQVEYTGAVLDGQVAYRPRFTADVGLGIGLPAGITLTPSGTHVGARRTVPGSPLNALAAYTLFNAGVGVPFELGRFAGRLELALTNLLDERAALLVDYPLPGRGWSTRIRLGTAR
ncbi:MAG: TonB-dependent receptor [Gemmatimonadales bacterium]|nr:TonB-dependent receptor [Candidatus Palauibacter denitrificans]